MKKIILTIAIVLSAAAIIWKFHSLEQENKQLKEQLLIEIAKVNGRVDHHLDELVDINLFLEDYFGNDWKAY